MGKDKDETYHSGEANKFENQEGADREEDSSRFAEDIVEDLSDGLRNLAGKNLGRVALK